MRHVAKKVGLYDLEMVSPWGCYFRTGGLAYDRLTMTPTGLIYQKQKNLYPPALATVQQLS